MYAQGNPKTKKQLKEWVAAWKAGERGPVYAFQPGPFPGRDNGAVAIEGPHYPQPHRWYAAATLEDGKIVSVK